MLLHSALSEERLASVFFPKVLDPPPYSHLRNIQWPHFSFGHVCRKQQLLNITRRSDESTNSKTPFKPTAPPPKYHKHRFPSRDGRSQQQQQHLLTARQTSCCSFPGTLCTCSEPNLHTKAFLLQG